MTQLHDLTLLEQADAVPDREMAPVGLVDHYLARIEHLNDDVGAFVFVAPDQARAAAKDAESALSSGQELPPLHGVPIAIKDLYITADMPTSFGSGAFPPMELGIDESFVTNLKRAGTISLVKTATPEFGAPCYIEPEGHPPARTPWDLSRSAGGSSGGAGAAVAAGLLPAAPGSDGGGSIRIPSSVNGLFGIQTSRGRVSTAPLNAEISGLSVHGPLARTVRDAAALLDAMAGPSSEDWIWQSRPETGPFPAACDQEPKSLRIGRYITPAVPGAVVDPVCVAAYEHASELLASLGHTVEEHPTTFGPELIAMFENLWSVEFASLPVPPEAEAGLRPLTRWLRERGRALSALDAWSSLATLRTTARHELGRTAHFDAVLTPTLAQPPAKVGGLRNDDDPAQDFENQKRYTPFTSPYNMSGQPSVNVPLHWTDDNLPIGIQLLGRPGDEVTLLRLAAQIEAAEPWAHRRPACW